MEFEWIVKIILDLIVEIKEYPYLWDTKRKNKEFDVFQNIATKFGTTAEKFSNLLQSYRRCRRKVKSCLMTGSRRNDIYYLSWFAYDSLN